MNKYRIQTALITALTIGTSCGPNPGAEETDFLNPEKLPRYSLQAQATARTQLTCEGIETHIKENLIEKMRESLAISYRSSQLDDFFTASGTPEVTSTDADYTSTNTQVDGIDEADITKTDGRTLFSSANGKQVRIIDISNPTQLKLLSTINIPGYSTELIYEPSSRRLVTLTLKEKKEKAPQQPSDTASDAITLIAHPIDTATQVAIWDVSNLTKPVLIQDVEFEGNLIRSRMKDRKLISVITESISEPAGISYWTQSKSFIEWKKLYEKNKDLILKADLNLKGRLGFTIQGKKITGDCSTVTLPSTPTEIGLVRIIQLDIPSHPSDKIEQTFFLGQADELYMNTDKVLISSHHWHPGDPQDGDLNASYIHAFQLDSSQAPKYLASGTFEGSLINQYAMDMNERGEIRLATTTTRQILHNPESKWSWERLRLERTNHVRIALIHSNGEIQEIGKTKELARDERIQSARFVGDRAYVVTYRNIDPLFVLDLSKPEEPKVLGELKIPGFSTYLHPLKSGHLLGVGFDETRGLKVSLFDVSEPSKPQEVGTWIPNEYSTSITQWDPRAFTYSESQNALTLPINRWKEGQFESSVKVIRIRTDLPQPFIDEGALPFSDILESSRGISYPSTVQRTMVLDSWLIGTSRAGIKSASLISPANAVSTLRFE